MPLSPSAAKLLEGQPCWCCEDVPATCYLHERLPVALCESCDSLLVAELAERRPIFLASYEDEDDTHRHWARRLLQIVDDRLYPKLLSAN